MTRIHDLVTTYHRWTSRVRLPAVHHFEWWAVALLVIGLVAVIGSAAVLLDADFRRMDRI